MARSSGAATRRKVSATGKFTHVSVSDVLGQVMSRFRDPRALGRLPAPQGDHRCRDLRKLLRVVRPGPVRGLVLPEVLEHGRDAASPSREEVPVHGGKLRAVEDEGREGASRVSEAPVGRCGSGAFDGFTKVGEVAFFRNRRDIALEEGHGGHGTAPGGRTERRLDTRPAHEVHRLPDGVDERDDVLDQALHRVVRVVAGQAAAAGARRVAGEAVGEVGHQRLVGNLAVAPSSMDQNHRWPLSTDSSDDLGAVGRNRNLHLSSHRHSSSRAPASARLPKR